ncbi:DNA-binding PucR family transcriptional regulator [Kineococcus xinjiangensis]|uniref:DNA-binding PucR family transcriptional regulator n=1 Tax=Kineococcus xinjiangensis TaxID=512762 RepID=A0A2S6IM56_9ACTN|nr:helix-turn-helix domain-containing protein [Kineococcus xinjiangensis]PPK95256.1 DNA-binding PucR family transcriptional regulator [Kineococcus xinjiangensis]
MADLQELVDAVADLTGAPVTLEDRAFHLVAASGHPGPIDAVRQDTVLHRRATAAVRARFESYGIARSPAPVRIPADPAQGLLARWCVPVRWQRVAHGYLWLLDDGRLPEADVARVRPLAEEAGAVLARRARRRADLSGMLDALLSADPARRERAAEHLADTHALPAGALAVVVLLPPSGTGPLEEVNAWRLPRGVLATGRDDGAVLLVPLGPEPATGSGPRTGSGPAEDALLAPARSVARRARDLLPERSRTAATGISDPVPTLPHVRAAWRQARAAALLAAQQPAQQPAPAAAVEWSGAGVARLLAHGRAEDLADAVLTPRVRALLSCGDAELLRTARAYLDAAGSAQRTAAELPVHRQTLYSRLRRLEAITGLDLDDGRDRLELHLALALLPVLPHRSG